MVCPSPPLLLLVIHAVLGLYLDVVLEQNKQHLGACVKTTQTKNTQHTAALTPGDGLFHGCETKQKWNRSFCPPGLSKEGREQTVESLLVFVQSFPFNHLN